MRDAGCAFAVLVLLLLIATGMRARQQAAPPPPDAYERARVRYEEAQKHPRHRHPSGDVTP